MDAAEIQSVRHIIFVRVAELANERLHALLLIKSAGRFRRHQRDGRAGIWPRKIGDGVLFDFPAVEIRFGVAVLGDSQFGFEREPAALRGVARFQMTVRIKLLGINPAKLLNLFNSFHFQNNFRQRQQLNRRDKHPQEQ